MIPDENDMCVSVGQLDRNDCHRLCSLSSLVHQNELTGHLQIGSHLQGSDNNISFLAK